MKRPGIEWTAIGCHNSCSFHICMPFGGNIPARTRFALLIVRSKPEEITDIFSGE